MTSRESVSRLGWSLHLYEWLIIYLFGGAIILVFLGLATLGTSYRSSIAQDINARIIENIRLCQYGKARSDTKKKKGLMYEFPCSDAEAANRLYGRGFVLYGRFNRKLVLELQQSPQILTTLVVSQADVGATAVGQSLRVRVPIIRSNEKVELANTKPASESLATAFKYAAIAYGLLWLIVLIFYRSIRQALVEAYRESTKA